ncbi:hypothetical protein [Nonomuraea dietziae]|uniref:hypothetical protein n=1 Tax=Nonomuraea dietziae TaxID=65515 RepID=UPI0031D4D144
MKKIAAGLIAATMGGALLVTGGAAAQATALDVQIEDINPDPVVVAKGGEATASFYVDVTKGANVELKVEPVGDVRTFAAKNVTAIPDGDHWKFTVPFNSGDAGKWRATATAKKDGETDRDKAYFEVEIQGRQGRHPHLQLQGQPRPREEGSHHLVLRSPPGGRGRLGGRARGRRRDLLPRQRLQRLEVRHPHREPVGRQVLREDPRLEERHVQGRVRG